MNISLFIVFLRKEEYMIGAKEVIKTLKEKGKVLPATYDAIFKALFIDPDMRGILAFMISEIIKIKKEYLYENMVIENSEIPKPNAFLKNNTTDILVSVLNKSILLEMNRYNNLDNEFRNIAHYYSQIVKNIRVADSYDTISMVYQINFDREKKFSNKLISEFKMMEVDTGIIEEEYFRKFRVSLAKVKDLAYTDISKLTKFERLLLILQLDSKKELRRIAKGDEELMAMERKIEELSEDPKYASLYDEEKLDKLCKSIWLHEETEKAKNKGIEQGLKQKQIETAKKMLNDKLDVDIVIKYTGLSKKEVLALKN